MHDDLKPFGHCLHPGLGQPHTLFFGEQVAFTRRAVDEDSLQTVAGQKGCVGGNGGKIYFTLSGEGRKGGIDQPFYLFHDMYIYKLN